MLCLEVSSEAESHFLDFYSFINSGQGFHVGKKQNIPTLAGLSSSSSKL